jgi:hypothetical protein
MARKKKGNKAQAGARIRRYAPELPPDVLHAIFMPLAGDMRTLCAAACVSTSWHTAVLHLWLWRKLHADRDGKLVAHNTMTDERLAALVRRACGVDSDGNVHKLLSLRVTFAPVTLRGVLAALRAPRNDDGEPLLRGSLRKLRVAGLPFPARGANKLIEGLNDFLRPSRFADANNDLPDFDLRGGMTACTHELDNGEVCGRAASTLMHWCEECNHALCGRCRIEYLSACEHMCSNCGCCSDDFYSCRNCEHGDHVQRYCYSCMCICGGGCSLDDGLCRNCARWDGDWDWCKGYGCSRSCCYHCSDDHMLWCGGDSCFHRQYCSQCEVENLEAVEGKDGRRGRPFMLCQVCRGLVQPAADALRRKLRSSLRFDYCSSSDEDEDE